MTTKTTAGDTQPAAKPGKAALAQLVTKVLSDADEAATPGLMRAAIEIAKALVVLQEPPPKRLTVTTEELCQMLNVGERTFHADIRQRTDFPQPVKLTDAARVVRWRVADLEAWLAAQETANDVQPEPVQLRAGKLKKEAEKLLAEAQKVRGRIYRSGLEQKAGAASA